MLLDGVNVKYKTNTHGNCILGKSCSSKPHRLSITHSGNYAARIIETYPTSVLHHHPFCLPWPILPCSCRPNVWMTISAASSCCPNVCDAKRRGWAAKRLGWRPKHLLQRSAGPSQARSSAAMPRRRILRRRLLARLVPLSPRVQQQHCTLRLLRLSVSVGNQSARMAFDSLTMPLHYPCGLPHGSRRDVGIGEL